MAELRIATLSGDYAVIGEAEVGDFRGSLYGETLLPGDDGYDGARRIWNAMIDKRPAMIARCSGTADVINSVNFARENNLLISVRGGGHNFPGNSVCNDGLMIDLSRMTGVRVDPAARTVRAPGRHEMGRIRPRDPCFRPGHHRRHRRRYRHRRPHPGRRHRLAVRQPRPELRQPDLRRRGNLRRPVADRQRRREPRPALGPARRRRQLRRSDLAGIPAPPHRPGGAGGMADLSCRQGEGVLPRRQ